MDESNALGQRLRAAREAVHLSIHQVAMRIDVHHSYLARIERGERTPSAEKLERLALVLKLDVTELRDYIGLKPEQMPTPRAFLRSAYGVDERKAAELVRLIEDNLKSNRRSTT